MTQERWTRLKQVFQEAIAREPQARPAFLAETCGEDVDLQGSGAEAGAWGAPW